MFKFLETPLVLPQILNVAKLGKGLPSLEGQFSALEKDIPPAEVFFTSATPVKGPLNTFFSFSVPFS